MSRITAPKHTFAKGLLLLILVGAFSYIAVVQYFMPEHRSTGVKAVYDIADSDLRRFLKDYLNESIAETAETIFGEEDVISGGTEKIKKPKNSTLKHNIPKALRGLIKDINELKGRHSDYITDECTQLNQSKQWITSSKFGFLGPFDYLPNYKNPCWRSSGQLQCVPYFYLIGAPKAGSTDLFWRTSGHPHVTYGKAKEVRWFDRQRFETQSMQEFKSYLGFFSKATQYVNESQVLDSGYHHVVIGDGSPTYYYSSYNWKKIPGNERCLEPRVTAMSHIHHLWPGAKLILLLRNPVTRLYSTYLYNTPFTGGNTTAAQFDKWVRQSMAVWYRCLSLHSFRNCMYDEQVIKTTSKISTLVAGFYSRYILDLLKLFPRNQLHVVQLEDYSNNKVEKLKEIYEFLELAPLSDSHVQYIALKEDMNQGKNYKSAGPMWESTKQLLVDFYKPYNKELVAIFHDDKYLWKDS